MAGCKAPGRALLGVLLLAAAAASAVDDEHMYHWKCFKSCMASFHDEDDGHHSSSKDRCLDECFEDLPAQCYHQCVVTNCLCFPPFSNEKTMCLKSCCDKCFHHGPPAPMPWPPTPAPPKPKPPPTPTPPAPKPPGPPKPKPPPSPKAPTPPSPKPPAPTKPTPPTPNKPPSPKKPPPSPKKPCPCPPGSEADDASNNN